MHSAELVWITPEAEPLIAKLARVSNPKNEDNPNYTKLIRYLIEHKHWSPFEMASMCVEIRTTRAISAQLLRHRSFSFQEFSQRYAPLDGPIPLPEMRLAGSTNRQSSTKTTHDYDDVVNTVIERAHYIYQDLLDAGVATETARQILPLCTPTRLYMSGTIRSWLHYVDLRTQPDTQLEHRMIAQAVGQILWDNLPNVHGAMWPE